MKTDRERRRAVSREAARSRRRKEADVFSALSHLLPLAPELLAHLDKPSVLRLTISYLHANTLLTDYGAGVRTSARDRSVSRRPRLASIEEEEEKGRAVRCQGDAMWLTRGEADLYLGVYEGFLLVVSTKGDMVFLSHNVSQHIGLTQVDLIGHSLYDFAHPCDHKEIENNLRISGDCCWPPQRDFVMRMKSTLTHRGRTTNIKSATWKVLHCEGRLKACTSSSSSSCPSCPSCSSYLLLSCKPLLLCHRLVVTHTFTSQHRLDLCFTRCDQRVRALLGYSPEELLGCSLYQLCHTLDYRLLTRSHLNLLSMSQSVSGRYRLVVRGGGYVWVESHSALLSAAGRNAANPSSDHSPHPSPAFIFSITYILSGVLEPSIQLSLNPSDLRHVT